MPIVTSAVNATKTKKEVDAISERVKKTKLKITDVIIPILVVAILIILGVFVFVPMIQKAITFQAEHKTIVEKEAQLQSLEKTLNAMDEGILQSDLVNAQKVIPNTLKVSSFMYYIDNLAAQKGLSSSEISAGDIKINAEGETSDGNYILGVSGPLAYEGTLTNALSFLDSLYSVSPYIITIENLDLEAFNNVWKIKLSVTGYYVPVSVSSVDIYSKFTPYSKFQDVVSIFETKASQLD
jgi:hypothetical protein